MEARMRLATAADAAGVLAIYAPIVRDTAISFEWEPPTLDEMEQRITRNIELLPWLICEAGGEVLGYAYAAPHRVRAAYRWSVESSVYVHERARHTGVGRGLYQSLLALLELQGVKNVYAGIALPNPASVALHEAAGFEALGVYPQVGYKLGAWHDVGWWRLALGPKDDAPAAPVPLPAIRDSAACERALTSGLAGLRL